MALVVEWDYQKYKIKIGCHEHSGEQYTQYYEN